MVTPARLRILVCMTAVVGMLMLALLVWEKTDSDEIAVIDCGEDSELDVRFEDGIQYIGFCDVVVYPDEYRMRGKYHFGLKSKEADLYVEVVAELPRSKRAFQTFHRLFQQVKKEGKFETFEDYLDNTIYINVMTLTGQEETYDTYFSRVLRKQLEISLERRFFGYGIDFEFPHFDVHITHDIEKD